MKHLPTKRFKRRFIASILIFINFGCVSSSFKNPCFSYQYSVLYQICALKSLTHYKPARDLFPAFVQSLFFFFNSIFHTFFSNVVPVNAWSHVAFTWERARHIGKLYINGVNYNSALADTTIEPIVDLKNSGHQIYDIGLKRDNGETSHVYLSGLAVFNRQLSNTEIINDSILNHPLGHQIM